MFLAGDRVTFEWVDFKGEKRPGKGVIYSFAAPYVGLAGDHALVVSDPPNVGGLRQMVLIAVTELRKET